MAVERCGCLGHCEEGPNLMLNGAVHVDMTPDRLRALVAALPRSHAGGPPVRGARVTPSQSTETWFRSAACTSSQPQNTSASPVNSASG